MKEYSIKVKMIDIRRCVEDACKTLFYDDQMADRAYRHIIDPLEDYLFECKAAEET